MAHAAERGRRDPHARHYALIHNFNAFYGSQGVSMEGSRKKSHKSAFTCPRCRANFNTAANLEKHQEMPCHWDPSRRATPLRMPDPQKWEQLLRYKTSASAELSPLTFYADLEVSSDRPPSEAVERITHRLQRRVASAAYLSVGHNGYLPSRRCWLDVMRAEDGPYAVVERFLTSLLRESQRYLDWTKNTNLMPPPSSEAKALFDAATCCARCQRNFVPDDTHKCKVYHHRHGIGEFIEALCADCNKGVRQPTCATVVFHNGGAYDFKFLLRAIAWLRGSGPDDPSQEALDVDEVPEAEEDAAAQDVPPGPIQWDKLQFSALVKSGEKLLQFKLGNLRFMDSVNFYKSSLGDLIDELAKTAKDGNLAAKFPHVAAIHPELQDAALTNERRRKLWQHFQPESPSDAWRAEPLETFRRWTWKLLLRKLPMPFDHMHGPEMWSKSPVWEREAYDSVLDCGSSELTKKRDAAYKLLRETCEIMGWTTFRQVHDCYLFMDLALADVMEAFRAVFFARFRLDPLQYVTLPGAAYDAMLFCTTVGRHKPAPRLICQEKIYRTVRSSIMGGLSCIFQPYARANLPGMDGYEPEKETTYIFSLDVNSEYPFVMTMPMPCSSGEWLPLPEAQPQRRTWLRELLDTVDPEAEEQICYLVLCDFTFPLERHDSLDWAPPARMNVKRSQLSDHSRSIMDANGLQETRDTKLVPFLGMHVKEGVDAKRLKFMIEVMGAVVTKVHSVISFKCQPWLRDFMRGCYGERLARKQQGQHVEAEMLKLVMNAIYGKVCQNMEGYKNTNLYTDEAKFVRAMNGHRMQDFDWLEDGGGFLGFIHNVGPRPRLQKSLIQVGWRVLELSRLLMMKNHYLGIKKLFPYAVPLFTDTDSITCRIASPVHPALVLARANKDGGRFPCFFDVFKELVDKDDDELPEALRELTEEELAICKQQACALGGFGLEYFPTEVQEFVGLRAKLYSLSFLGEVKKKTSKQRAKGVKKAVMPGHERYLECMRTMKESYVKFSAMVSEKHRQSGLAR